MSSADLNLLAALDALLSEGTVTGADQHPSPAPLTTRRSVRYSALQSYRSSISFQISRSIGFYP
jgi:hypothetical protein